MSNFKPSARLAKLPFLDLIIQGQAPPPLGGEAGTSANVGTFILVHILQGTLRLPLPVPVNHELPAIDFPFGIACNDSCPKIYCVVDTGAGATYRNSKFCGKIAISFPHILHATVVASKAEHDPLTFSGVVGEDEGIVTAT